jgi:pSer/pThr/pTyr-binding forkhead associated (FHA) protein
MSMNKAILYQIGDDDSPAEQWEIDEGAVVVGRSGQAQVSVKDDGLSRRHFLIVHEGEDYVIKDLNSRNGTWVGGHRVSAEKLHHKDLILAGHTRFRFAALPRLPAAFGRTLAGPNGTVILPAVRARESTPSEAALIAD